MVLILIAHYCKYIRAFVCMFTSWYELGYVHTGPRDRGLEKWNFNLTILESSKNDRLKPSLKRKLIMIMCWQASFTGQKICWSLGIILNPSTQLIENMSLLLINLESSCIKRDKASLNAWKLRNYNCIRKATQAGYVNFLAPCISTFGTPWNPFILFHQ